MEVYLANTPYHLILSIINGCLRRDSMVFLLDMTGALERYAGAEFAAFFNGRFRYVKLGSVHVAQKIINRNSLLAPITGSKTADVVEFILRRRPECVYAFNDSFPEVQYILSRCKNFGAKYIEDGSAPYNSHSVKHSIPQLAQKILYGIYYDRINVLGTSRYVDENIFCYPQFARKENMAKPISQLAYEADSKLDLCRFSKLFDLEDLVREIGDLPINLFLLPPFENDSVVYLFERLVKESGGVSLVKQHPLSKLPLSPILNFVEVNSFIPAEALLFRFKNIQAVYGYPTTTLLATKYLMPEVAVYCVLPDGSGDNFFIDNLMRSGVEIIRSSV